MNGEELTGMPAQERPEPEVPEPEVPAPEPAAGQEPARDPEEPGRQEEFMGLIRRELEAIRQFEPEVGSLQDLLKLDRHEAMFDEMKNHNHTLWEAYRIVYADRIAEARLREEARRSRESRQSKAHLRPVGTVGTGQAEVPSEVERNIRAILPRATKQEIREFYRRDAKKFG